ncbi:MAG: hypothetical protein CMJ31_00155 [Phycisphaerae bacterium]|nr:hypothetical protein [Phycisphaerae bacterium]
MKTATVVIALALASAAASATAQEAYAWGENVGWINLNPEADEAQVGLRYVLSGNDRLAGFAWGENIGWVNFGNGDFDGYPLACDQMGSGEFGVYLEGESGDAVRLLRGWAWAENAGWINFNVNCADPGAEVLDGEGQFAGARLEGGALDGFAWAENLGWINLNGAVLPCSPSDMAMPIGVVDIADVVAFLQAFGSMDPAADFALPNGVFDIADVVSFLQVFGQGCP